MEEPILVKKASLTDKVMLKQKKYLMIAAIFIVTLFVGSSYALLTNFKKTDEVINITTGNLNVSVTNALINLNNKLPESDINGLSNATPAEILLTNTGTLNIMKYEVKLVRDTTQTSTMNNECIKYAISLDGTTYESSRLLSETDIIYTGYNLGVNQSKTIYLKTWIAESSGNNALGKTFYGSIDVKLYQKADVPFQYKIPQNVNYIQSYNANKGDASFDTQDTVETNLNKLDVLYYTTSSAKQHSNVLFAGYCWQIIRTTDTGGLKIIYNGPAENNKCLTTRNSGGTLKGINADGDGLSQSMAATSSSTVYGTGFDYNLNTGTFTLTGTFSNKTWSNDYKDILGNYTCLDNTTTCSILYYIGQYQSETSAYVSKYVIGLLASNTQIGTSSFNTWSTSPALIGYMYNNAYPYKSGIKTGNYANSVTWNGTNYVLDAGTTTNLTAPDATHHYVCDTDCSKVRYYYYSGESLYYYILLENGDINPIYVMLNGKTQGETTDANINRYSSAIKGQLDNWYKKNIDTLNSSIKGLIDTSSVFCNDRRTTDIGAWDKDSEITSTIPTIKFYQYLNNNDLRCPNITDRFSVGNTSANLTYPVGIITEAERYLMGNNYAATQQGYWSLSPYTFDRHSSVMRNVYSSGSASNNVAYYSRGVRPVITIRAGANIEEGDGSYDTPYVIGDKLVRDFSNYEY